MVVNELVMRNAGLIVLFFLLLLSGSGAAAQENNPAMGTDFWFTFMSENVNGANGCLVIVAPQGCQGVLENPSANYYRNINIQPGETDTIRIPLSISTHMGNMFDDAPYDDFPVVQSVGMHLSTDRPVLAFADDSYRPQIQDVATIWPTSALGSEYVGVCYRGGEVRILAAEDSALVDYYPSMNLGQSPSSTPVSMTLHRGQVVGIASRIGFVNGSRIVVRNGKKVAVFVGSRMVEVVAQANDELFTQLLPPLPVGDYEYMLPRMPHDEYICLVRDMGSGSTVIARGDTNNPIQLAPYRYVEFPMDSSRFANYRAIQVRNGSVEVAIVTMGQLALRNPVLGDPAMTMVLPFGRVGGCDYKFRTLGALSNPSNYLLVTGDLLGVNGHLWLDGQALGGAFQYEGAGSNAHFYGQIPVSIGEHTLHVPDGARVSVFLTGTLNYGRFLTQLPMNQFRYNLNMSVNGIIYHDTMRVCEGSPVRVEPESMVGIDSLMWNTDGIWRQAGNFYTMQMPDYTVDIGCRAYFADDTGAAYGVEKWVTIVPIQSSSHELDIASCAREEIHGFRFDSSCTHQFVLTNSVGCDSLLTINFTLLTSESESDTSICQGEVLNWEGRTLTLPGAYTQTYRLSNGCDSIVRLNLSLLPKPTAAMELSDSLVVESAKPITATDVSEGAIERGWWYNHQWVGSEPSVDLYLPSDQGRAEVTLVVANELGCQDSATKVIKRDGCRIWAPNAILPGQGENGVFRIKSEGVLELEVAIFNRQGQHLCTFNGLTEGWDGTYGGHPLPEGSYVWLARYRGAVMSEAWHVIKGTVTLIR